MAVIHITDKELITPILELVHSCLAIACINIADKAAISLAYHLEGVIYRKTKE
jgi:hypothetical protein